VHVFDALTSKRPYKRPLPIDKSFRIIKEGREGQFAPDVADAFFALGNEIMGTKETYKDESQSLLFQLAGRGA
jgi:putative two-component system response regulator